MPVLETAIALVGVLLVLLGLADAFLTILHPDWDGPASLAANRAIWSTAVLTARSLPRLRRESLALAGPLMVIGDVLLWMLLPIFGYALLVYPFLRGGFDAPAALSSDLLDALYFSGVTFTTLGFGDITPVTPGWEMLAVAEAITGFLVMGTSIAYIVAVFEGVDQRDAMALRIYSETGGTWDATRFLRRSLEDEDVPILRERLEAWADLVRQLHGRLYRFHGLAFYLRTRGLQHGPERMLYALADAAVAANVLARSERMRPLRPAAEHLSIAFEHFMRAVLRRHGTRASRHAMAHPAPTEEDARRLEEIWRDLAGLYGLPAADDPTRDPALLEMAARARTFLAEVDRVTCWRSLRDAPVARP